MDEVLATIESPDWVTAGYHAALAAWKGRGRKRYLAVIYREMSKQGGFVITAFVTSKPRRKNKIWPSRR